MSRRYRARKARQQAERRSRREEEQYYQELRMTRLWTVEERRKWDRVFPKLQELIRTFPYTAEGEILAEGWEERALAETMKRLISLITELVKRGNPEGLRSTSGEYRKKETGRNGTTFRDHC
jgi:hypothetical protein